MNFEKHFTSKTGENVALGGKRPGAGRKKGGKNSTVLGMKLDGQNLLVLNKDILINKAIALATQRKPNVAVLLKLLDKIAPSLSSAADTMNLKTTNPTGQLSDDDLKALVVKLASAVHKREEDLNNEKSSSGKK